MRFMLRIGDIALPLDHPESALRARVASILRVAPEDLRECRVVRRSVDARKRNAVALIYTVDVSIDDESGAQLGGKVSAAPDMEYRFSLEPPRPLPHRPIVIGAGPCGLFGALLLAQNGFEPILLERGKSVKERAGDVHAFWRSGTLNPASNALFGEGGAGAFSDGKLTTQIKERENRCAKVLSELVAAGAPEEILWLHKPHIGTDNLVRVVENLRRAIEGHGGEVRFNSRVSEIAVEGGTVCGVRLDDGTEIASRHVLLAIGHSARDTFEMLHKSGAAMAQKAFSIGARIEHSQRKLDYAQYGKAGGHPRLGAADYKLVHHCGNGRSVYTFCMCPGGEVIAASSEPGQVVTNGMSRYARNAPNANSGLLVGVGPEDFGDSHPLAGVAYQRRWEELAFAVGGGHYRAPAQTVGDLLAGRTSSGFGGVKPSYTPGVTPADLSECLPPYVIGAFREALPQLARKLAGFALPDAVLTGVETRSSSPVRILRTDNCESETLRGLYPAGEGAGYAGGIMSAAVDGVRVAESIMRAMTSAGG
jgi:uncharacterized FAD-dependent dehydrogenase